ncbi:DoxX family protein [Sphingomicrobium lutaoense]|uniref:Putative oxidoreductase n=1 Tax=Sphingomicrobium lutaoense TaxID=515949 RepID=A0A839YSX2_9SPHN|nr:DoxX family protein [Sphingomicrobium lutaoense]MBB3763381.1 putative oxidoreductase [Sphingomicrobium lutaoense]
MNGIRDYLSPLARVFLAAVFIVSGFAKIGEYEATAAYMESQGVPGLLLPLVILTEVGGGLMVVLGWHARTAALLLAGFSLLSGILFHLVPAMEASGAEQIGQMAHFWKNTAIAGGMLLIVANGPGLFSMEKTPYGEPERDDESKWS